MLRAKMHAKLFSKLQRSIPEAIRHRLQLQATREFVLLQRGRIIELIPSQSFQATRGMLGEIDEAARRDYRDRRDKRCP
jgi:bifunctional DNA-binding transcriptional regulator/antitoxin component of YhaV-PrlF toxin-antitoxin module